jgi:hypothetical protein
MNLPIGVAPLIAGPIKGLQTPPQSYKTSSTAAAAPASSVQGPVRPAAPFFHLWVLVSLEQMASGGVVVACAPELLADVLRPCSKLVSPAPPAEQICVRMAELLESLLQDRPGSPSPPASPTRSLSSDDLRISPRDSPDPSRPLFSTGAKPLNTACFDAIRPPGISLKAYLERFVFFFTGFFAWLSLISRLGL